MFSDVCRVQLAGNGDIITMTADDTGDTVSFMFESPEQARQLPSCSGVCSVLGFWGRKLRNAPCLEYITFCISVKPYQSAAIP